MAAALNDHEKPFLIIAPPCVRTGCRKCKQKCYSNQMRIAKVVPNHLSDSGMMNHWYHIDCLFQLFKLQIPSARKINSVDDVNGWDNLSEEQKNEVSEKLYIATGVALNREQQEPPLKAFVEKKTKSEGGFKKSTSTALNYLKYFRQESIDNLMFTFGIVLEKLALTRKHSSKTDVLRNFFIEGTNGIRFAGDLYLWIKMLIPSAEPRNFNLNNRQIIRIFAKVFRIDAQRMLRDMDKGDVSITVCKYFELSKVVQPVKMSHLTMQKVEQFLTGLALKTKDEERVNTFKALCPTISIENLKWIIRLIKHDMQINVAHRHVLDALHPLAFSAFDSLKSLKLVVEKYPDPEINALSIEYGDLGPQGVQLMVPISPMLSETVRSVYNAIDIYPEGLYGEIKYDGERLQIHKNGANMKFFGRDLKVIDGPKIEKVKDYVPMAFPDGETFIIDCEMIFVNRTTAELVPMDLVSINTEENFKNIQAVIFVFDIVYYNGVDLIKRPLMERRRILEKNMEPVIHAVQLVEIYPMRNRKEVANIVAQCFSAGLEGMVLKGLHQTYEAGKRGWVKVKKSCMFEGKMIDTADLVILGAWLGTGYRADTFGVYLMGCYDPTMEVWKTVTKVFSGLNDALTDQMNNLLSKIMVRTKKGVIPKWLVCKEAMLPDYVAINPFKMPVLEITGEGFVTSDLHTANNITIRFPRVKNIRYDKASFQHTNLQELLILHAVSQQYGNYKYMFVEEKVNPVEYYFQLNVFRAHKQAMANNCSRKNRTEPKPGPSGNNLTKRTPSVAEETQNNSPPKKIIKSGEINTSLIYNLWNLDIDIFKDEIIYFRESLENVLNPAAPLVIMWKGQITDNSKEATIVIHINAKSKQSLDNARLMYSRSARHVTYKWLIHSLKKQRLLSFRDYAVEI